VRFAWHFGVQADGAYNRRAHGEAQMAIEIRGAAPLLQVFDMPTSLRFYCDALGFELVNSSAPPPNCGWCLLRLNRVEIMLNTAYDEGERPAAPDPARIVAHGDTILYFGCPDVDGAYEHVRAKGIEAKKPHVAPYGMKQLYVNDPDGFGLCFQWPASKE
jgi:glyoxylase I family protein